MARGVPHQRRLLAVLAHPDDETLGLGGTLAKYADDGVDTYLLTATRGQQGWPGEPDARPTPQALGQLREKELRAAAAELGVAELTVLDYMDGELSQADPTEIVPRLAAAIRRLRPQVVVTFPPDGVSGHPDHMAISQFTTAAVIAAASPLTAAPGPTHQVSKLYYRVMTQDDMDAYVNAFGGLAMEVDGQPRAGMAWPAWAITAEVDARPYWEQVWTAAQAHRSQLPPDGRLDRVTPQQHAELWGRQRFYRVFSLVGGDGAPETDLFAGVPRC